jgi:hypothetical protein
MYINSKDVFERTSLNTLIDDLLDKKQYEAFENPTNYKKNEIKKETVNNNIYYRFLNYIKSYYDKLRELNKSNKFITYEEDIVPTIDGVGKKIYFIGDIHGDFPRLVQLLYNAKFITFRGPAWAKVNLLNSGVTIDDDKFSEKINDPLDYTSIIQYINGKDIFKEVVWLAENTLFISTGDLVDSVRETNSSDNIGDYELRIHLLLMILREQAINKNSFIHFVIGNHDNDTLNYSPKSKYVGEKSIKYFKSLSCRSLILSNFYIIYPSFCIYINYHASHVIFTAHGSLFKFDNSDKLASLTDIQFVDSDNYKKPIKANYTKDQNNIIVRLTTSRSSIKLFKIKNINNEFTIDNMDENLNKFLCSILLKIEETIKNKDKDKDSLRTYKLSDDDKDIIKKILEIKADDQFPADLSDNDADITDEKISDYLSKIENIYKQLIEKIEFKFTDTNYTDSLLYKEIQEINKDITHCVFGHTITDSLEPEIQCGNTTKDSSYLLGCNNYQSGKIFTHSILSTLADHIFFVDIALSKCFYKRDNEYFELLELDATSRTAELPAAHLRIYTDPNRYQLGAPRQAELFKAENPTHFIPQLKPIGDYFTPIMT